MSTATAAEKWAEMKPRERDAWVAENVMGWEWIVMRVPEGPFRYLCPPDSETAQRCRIPEWAETSDHDWRGPRARGDEKITSETGRMMPYTTDAAADYEVLRRVRETWSESQQDRFGSRLNSILVPRYREAYRAGRVSDYLMLYLEPGDYSTAAYLALSELIQSGGRG